MITYDYKLLLYLDGTSGITIEGKVEGLNTSYDPDHKDKRDHVWVHLYIHLNMGGNTEVNVEGLNPSCDHSHMDLSLPSMLLANVQALDNKLDDLHALLSFQRDIRSCNVLCFTEI